MQRVISKRRTASGALAMLLSLTVFSLPLAGCSSDERRMPPPPVDDSRGYSPSNYDTSAQAPMPQQQTKMSNSKKLVILAGAAALYYLYKKNQQARQQGANEPQYYLSKNGRVYYRDQGGQAHWVTPPPQGIQVPEDEAYQYSQYQGFNGRPDGMDLTALANQQSGPDDSGAFPGGR